MSFRNIPWYSTFLHLTLAALTVVSFLLMNENRALRGAIGPREITPEVGELLQPIAGRGLDGQSVEIVFEHSEREKMLLVFTTTCPACKQNLGNWQVLWERYRENYDIVGISIDSIEATRSYVEANDLPFDIVVPEEPAEFSLQYRIAGVPETIHASIDGRVEKVWLGILPERFLEEMAPGDIQLSELGSTNPSQ